MVGNFDKIRGVLIINLIKNLTSLDIDAKNWHEISLKTQKNSTTNFQELLTKSEIQGRKSIPQMPQQLLFIAQNHSFMTSF